MHPALTQYVHTTSHDFRQRLALQPGDTPDEHLDRFSLALDYFDLWVTQEHLPETVSARLPKQNRTGIKFALPCWGGPTVA